MESRGARLLTCDHSFRRFDQGGNLSTGEARCPDCGQRVSLSARAQAMPHADYQHMRHYYEALGTLLDGFQALAGERVGITRLPSGHGDLQRNLATCRRIYRLMGWSDDEDMATR